MPCSCSRANSTSLFRPISCVFSDGRTACSLDLNLPAATLRQGSDTGCNILSLSSAMFAAAAMILCGVLCWLRSDPFFLNCYMPMVSGARQSYYCSGYSVDRGRCEVYFTLIGGHAASV